MKIKLFIGAILSASTLTFAAESCLGNSKINISQVQKAIGPILGNAKVVNVSDAPISGLYEVIVESNGKKVPIYVDCDLKYILNGEIIDINKKVSLTRERFAQLQQQANNEKEVKLAKILGKDKVEALKKEGLIDYINTIDTKNLPVSNVKYGNGPTKIYVFTDPQCPFCAKLHQSIKEVLSKRKDVTFEMILYPLPFHKYASNISQNIECQKDNAQKQKLLDTAFENTLKNNESGLSSLAKACNTAVSKINNNLNFGKSHEINGTPTIVFPKGIAISGALPSDTLNKLIDLLK